MVFDEDIFPLTNSSPPPNHDTLLDVDRVAIPLVSLHMVLPTPPTPRVAPSPLTMPDTALSPLPTPCAAQSPPTVPHVTSLLSTMPHVALYFLVSIAHFTDLAHVYQ